MIEFKQENNDPSLFERLVALKNEVCEHLEPPPNRYERVEVVPWEYTEEVREQLERKERETHLHVNWPTDPNTGEYLSKPNYLAQVQDSKARLEIFYKHLASQDKLTDIDKYTYNKRLDIFNDFIEYYDAYQPPGEDFIRRKKQYQRLSEHRAIYNKNTFMPVEIEDQLKATSIDEEKHTKISKSLTLMKGQYYETYQIKIGLCGEFVALALQKLYAKSLHVHCTKIEQIIIDYGSDNHTFLVFNRSDDSELSDMQSWGDEAILFDAWNQLVTTIKDYFDRAKTPKRYAAYSADSEWKTIEFTQADEELQHGTAQLFIYFKALGLDDVDKRLTRVEEEFDLHAIDGDLAPLNQLLEDIVAEVKPDEFVLPYKFYVTTSGDSLFETIPGFTTPIIAIHTAFLLGILKNGDHDIEELKFAIASALLCMKNYLPEWGHQPHPHQQQEIDQEALQKCANIEAAVAFFRHQAVFKKAHKHEHIAKLPGHLDNDISKEISFEERIKALETFVVHYEIKYQANNSEPVAQPAQLIEALDRVKKTLYFTMQFDRLNTLEEQTQFLIANLDSLNLELYPFEIMNAPLDNNKPCIRAREFCQLLTRVVNTPESEPFVDKILTAAFAKKIPCFDYLYRVACGIKKPHKMSYEPGSLKKLGPFKALQNTLIEFTQAQDLDSATQTANALLEQFTTLRNYLLTQGYSRHMDGCDHSLKHTPEHRILGNGSFGDGFLWGVVDESLNLNPAPLTVLAEQDPSQAIAKVLLLTGYVNYRLFALFDYQDLYQLLYSRYDYQSEVYLSPISKAFVDHHHQIHGDKKMLSKHIAGFYYYNHQVVPLADNQLNAKSLHQYVEDNLPLLTCSGTYPDEVWETNNEAFNDLLNHLMTAAESNDVDQHKLVRDFFLNKKGGLNSIKTHYRGVYKSDLSYRSVMTCFVIFYIGKIFTEKQATKFLLNRVDTKSIPIDAYRDLYDIPFEPSSLEYIKFVATQILKHQQPIAFTHIMSFFEKYFKQHGRLNLFDEEGLHCFQFLLFQNNDYLPNKYQAKRLMKRLNKFFNITGDSAYGNIDYENIPTFIIIYRLFNKHNRYQSHDELQHFSELVYDYINAFVNVQNKQNLLEQLLFCGKAYTSTTPISNITLRNKAITNWVDIVLERYGKDDNSPEYYEALKNIITKVIDNTSRRDTSQILSQLLDAIEAQERLCVLISTLLERRFSNNKDKNKFNTGPAVYIAATLNRIAQEPEYRIHMLNFLSSPLSPQSTSKLASYMMQKKRAKKLIKDLGYRNVDKITQPQVECSLIDLHSQFWALDLPYRVLAINNLLIPASSTISEVIAQKAYTDAFEFITNKLFPNAGYDGHKAFAVALLKAHVNNTDSGFNQFLLQACERFDSIVNQWFPHASQDSQEAFAAAFLHSYLAVADKYQRGFLLAACIVTHIEHADSDNVSVGKKLAAICMHMGPAYIKLAQAIESHPQTPADIKADLADIKGRANPPLRWDIWDLMKRVVPEDELKKIAHVGKLLGSASYHLAVEVTLQNGDEAVLLLLRNEAKKEAQRGFDHLSATVQHCQHPTMKTIEKPVMLMIEQAQKMSEQEMNHITATKQNAIAQSIYDSSSKVTVCGQPFELVVKAAKIRTNGDGYRILDRMWGKEFNDLPSESDFDQALRSKVAKALLMLEFKNFIAGNSFDCDRHGAQCRVEIDQQSGTIIVGLYDFGEMALDAPDQEEKQQLNAVILECLRMVRVNRNFSAELFDNELSKHINRAIEDNQPYEYMVRFRKACLALSDLLGALNQDDVQTLLTDMTDVAQFQVDPCFEQSMNKAAELVALSQQYENVMDYMFGWLGQLREIRFAFGLNDTANDPDPALQNDAPTLEEIKNFQM